MRTLLTICLCLAFSPAFATPVVHPPPSAYEIVQKEGQLVFTDGTTCYDLEKNGIFLSGPTGMCGQTITGHWELWQNSHGDMFVVDGTWGFMNGLSKINDFRMMLLSVHPKSLVPMKRDEAGMFVVPSVPPKLLRVYYCDFTAQKPVTLPEPK